MEIIGEMCLSRKLTVRKKVRLSDITRNSLFADIVNIGYRL